MVDELSPGVQASLEVDVNILRWGSFRSTATGDVLMPGLNVDYSDEICMWESAESGTERLPQGPDGMVKRDELVGTHAVE